MNGFPQDLGRRFAGVCVGAALVAGVAALSQRPWRVFPEDAAELRVSWRLPAVATRTCRPPTEDEVRGVAPHMRPSEVCVGEIVPFGLRIVVDGDTLLAGPLSGRGAGRGRTMSVFESFPLPPGERLIEIAFGPDPPRPELPEAPRLALSETVRIGAREVALVTLGETGRLEVERPARGVSRPSRRRIGGSESAGGPSLDGGGRGPGHRPPRGGPGFGRPVL